MNEITFGKKSLTNSFHSSSLFLFQRIKYWELDYACSLCWPFFQCSLASSHMGSANQRGYTSLFSRQRHFYHNHQVISSYLWVWKVECFYLMLDPCNNLSVSQHIDKVRLSLSSSKKSSQTPGTGFQVLTLFTYHLYFATGQDFCCGFFSSPHPRICLVVCLFFIDFFRKNWKGERKR